MNDAELLGQALECIYKGTEMRVMLKGKKPTGFPRGEHLADPTDEVSIYIVNPVKICNWIYKRKRQAYLDSLRP